MSAPAYRWEPILDSLPFTWYGKSIRSKDDINGFIIQLGQERIPVPAVAEARMRDATFRDKPSVELKYTRIPVVDWFREVDDKTLLGILTILDQVQGYFYIERE